MQNDPKIEVLVVEDEEPIRTGLCDVLSYHGYHPEPVERGDDAPERARTGRPALLLPDVMRPGPQSDRLTVKLYRRGPREASRAMIPMLVHMSKRTDAAPEDGVRVATAAARCGFP